MPATKLLVESLSAKIRFEKGIEGRALSPRWYVSQLIARSFGEQVVALFSRIATIPEAPPENLLMPTKAEEAAIEIMVLQRNMEAISRLLSHEEKFVRFAQHLKAFEKIKDLPIATIEEGVATEKFGAMMDRCFDRLGDLVLPVFQDQRDHEMPDFFGMTYFRLCNELFRQLEGNEHARFASLYPKALKAAFFARQRLMKEYEHLQDAVTRARISFDPIFDLMALGGYAAFYSELNESPTLVETVTSAWLALFAILRMEENKCDWLLKIYQVTTGDLRFSGRDPTRFNWWRQLVAALIERHFIEERFARFGGGIVEPTTSLLKVLCRNGSESHEDVRELFLAIFLPRLGATEQIMNALNSRFYRELRRNEEAGEA